MNEYTVKKTASSKLRDKLDHPVIDGDGHIIESRFVLPDFLKQVGGESLVKRWEDAFARRFGQTGKRPKSLPWSAHTGKGTLDRVTCMLPNLYARRLEEAGVDFATLYPTLGFGMQTIDDEEVRRGGCRALNMMYADMFAEVKHKMTPAACIPMHTPEEAIEELEFAVKECGLKAAMIASEVLRPIAEVEAIAPELNETVKAYSSLTIDSPYDYDPFWAKCVGLGVAPSTHSINMTGTHGSPTSYLFNRIGLFGTAGYAAAKGIFISGVTQRFPDLNIAFLEGGVWYAVALYNDLFEFWEKRNKKSMLERHDPANADIGLMANMYEQFGNEYLSRERFLENKDFYLRDGRKSPDEEIPEFADEWRHVKIESKEDIRDLFTENLYFGCEADDAMNYTAFNTKANRMGAKIKAIFSSDLGHWDVVDFGDVLEEAHEAVDDGLMTDEDFREFVFTNPVKFATRGNPDYFKGTVVEDAVAKLVAGKSKAA